MNRIYTYLSILLLFISYFIINFIFPLHYYNEISEMSQKYGVKRDIIYSVIKIESDFSEKIISHKGAMGLMQIMPVTGEWIAKTNNLPYSKEKLLNPRYNIKLGTIYLKYLLNRYSGDIKKVLIAYNAGPNRLKDGSWKQFKETKNYILKYNVTVFFYKIKLFLLKLS